MDSSPALSRHGIPFTQTSPDCESKYETDGRRSLCIGDSDCTHQNNFCVVGGVCNTQTKKCAPSRLVYPVYFGSHDSRLYAIHEPYVVTLGLANPTAPSILAIVLPAVLVAAGAI